jgi:hypothetical protein
MPRTIDLFVDSDLPLDRLAARLAELTAHRVTPAPDGARFVVHAGDSVAHLYEHDFLDDDGLPLSEFRYVLSTSVGVGTDLESSAELEAMRAVSGHLRGPAGLPCLLVIDLERPDGAGLEDGR